MCSDAAVSGPRTIITGITIADGNWNCAALSGRLSALADQNTMFSRAHARAATEEKGDFASAGPVPWGRGPRNTPGEARAPISRF